ncbi:MAG: carbonic anhydrase/acetyltransferase-like protein (isoleucine patch superfamily) [Pseudohongiellaceae bacterium]|jgi:carbonic anhydrase/acetyltransferase-like protein (isoleucine patch superfamily)
MTSGERQPQDLRHGPSYPAMVSLGEALAATTAVIWGDVTLGAEVNVWYGAVIRGDCAPITVGARTNVQDLAVLHADTGVPLDVGCDVTIGHSAIVHGRRVGDCCLIGIGAKVLGRSEIGAGSVIAAGAVIREGAIIPPRSLVAGVPGRVMREVSDEELALYTSHAATYIALAKRHLRPSL